MQDLNYELKQLCARNRDGSFATQHDRERILTLIANQLREMGFVNMHVQSLKPKHVEKLVERWKAEGLSTGTLKNRMTELRWWAEKNGKANVVAKSNDAYGIADRRYVTNVSKARAADLRRSRPGHRPVHAHVAPAASDVRAAAQRVASRFSRLGRIAATPCCSRPVGAKVVARARSRSAMPSNATSWMRRSALPARAV